MEEKIRNLNVNLSTAMLYIYAIQNGYDASKVNISDDDLSILLAHKIIIKVKDKYVLNNDDQVEEWIDDWRNLFVGAPRGTIGNKGACITNMYWFIGQTKYTKRQIFEATQNYVTWCNNVNRYAKDPQKFILDQQSSRQKTINMSMLFDWCNKVPSENQFNTIL